MLSGNSARLSVAALIVAAHAQDDQLAETPLCPAAPPQTARRHWQVSSNRFAAITQAQADDSRWPQRVPSRQCKRASSTQSNPGGQGKASKTAGSDDMQQGRQAPQQARAAQFDLDRKLHRGPACESRGA
jgi:hypothetical protein